MRAKTPLFFMASFVSFFAQVSLAADIKVVTEIFPPFSYVEDGKVVGKITQDVEKILQSSEVSYSIEAFPWARAYHYATTQENVLIYPIFRNAQREKLFHWICPIHPKTPAHAFKLASNPIPIDSIEALRSVKIGVTRADNSHLVLQNLGFLDGVNLDVVASDARNLTNLVNGKIDAVIQIKDSIEFRAKDIGLAVSELQTGVQLHPELDHGHCAAMSLETPPEVVAEIMKGFNTWLDANNTTAEDLK